MTKMQLIDTHVHINFDVFQPDLEVVRSRWLEAGVVHLVHSCVEPSEFAGIQAIAHRFPEVSFAVGLHPLDAEKWTEEAASTLKALALSDKKIVAIGETGLDFYKSDHHEQQIKVFEAQLAIASELKLPVIIHCREAASQVREILRKWQNRKGDIRGVMHCWGGTIEETSWFLDLDFYISFSGTVTFKKALQIQESAAFVRSDRLLIETDCPFLTPVPYRGQKRNEPAYVRYVAEQVALLRHQTISEVASITTQNACELFGLAL